MPFTSLVLKQQDKLKRDINNVESNWKYAGVRELEILNHKTKEFKQYLNWKSQLEHLSEVENKLIKLQKTDARPYFLWHLWFKDVFDNDGFDILIGNPPYIQLQKMGNDATELGNANYETFTKTGDIYCLFYEQGMNLLKPNGTLCYITSNTWMRTKFGEVMRRYFAKKTNPIKLLNFEDTKIFQAATVETNIILIKKTVFKNLLKAVAVKTDYSLGTSIVEYFNNNLIELYELPVPNEGWIILSKEDFEIMNLISKKGKTLKNWDVEINFGFKTGFNDPFFIDEKKRKELIQEDQKSSEIIKPLLRGRDIRKFAYTFNNEYVIFAHNGYKEYSNDGIKVVPRINIEEDYVAVYKHLLQYKDQNSPLAQKNKDGTWHTLIDRADSGDHWTNLRDCAYANSFEKPKLIWLGISDKPAFAYDESHYITAPANLMTGANLKYHLGILNSKIIEWYLDKITSSTGQGTNQWKKIYVEQLPIPDIQDNLHSIRIERIVDYLLYLNNDSNPQISSFTDNNTISNLFEEVLNMMVYELYFEQQMIELDIDVFKYIDLEIVFKDINIYSSEADKKEILSQVYNYLLDKENPIRKNIILSNIKSPNIIARINASTH